MLGVKIVLLLFVISFVWHIITNAMCKSANLKTMVQIADPTPWWFLLDGFLIILDLFGLIYLACYFLFVYF